MIDVTRGDVLVRKVANGYLLIVHNGHGMESSFYVAADIDTLPDVLKQAVVSRTLAPEVAPVQLQIDPGSFGATGSGRSLMQALKLG